MKIVRIVFLALVVLMAIFALANAESLKIETRETIENNGITLVTDWGKRDSIKNTIITLKKSGRLLEELRLNWKRSFLRSNILRATMGSLGCETYLSIDEPGDYVVTFAFESDHGEIYRKEIEVSKSPEGKVVHSKFRDL